MYPAQFEYHKAGTVKEAVDLLAKYKDDAKLLAGGHSLLPAMKLRLAQPKHLIDIGKVSRAGRDQGGRRHARHRRHDDALRHRVLSSAQEQVPAPS